MTLPGFTADRSLYRTQGAYAGGGAPERRTDLVQAQRCYRCLISVPGMPFVAGSVRIRGAVNCSGAAARQNETTPS